MSGPAGDPGTSTTTLAMTTVLGPSVYDPAGPFSQAKAKAAVNGLEWTTCFFALYGGDRSLASSDVEEALGESGVATRFAVGLNGAPQTGSWTFTLMKGEVPLLPPCTIAGANRTCQSTGSGWFGSTDKLSIQMTAGSDNNTPAGMFSHASFQVKYTLR